MSDSPLSGEEAYVPSLKKSRRGAHKKVVTVPIGSGNGHRSKGEVYPPPDSWSWRKYGQKPIKGSPYPRGYYKCSSSKGCPARKQLERSRLDPTMLLITYYSDHSHTLPTTTKNHHREASAASASTTTKNLPPAHTNQPDIEPTVNCFTDIPDEFSWLCNVGPNMMDRTSLVGPTWTNADVDMFMPIGEEDELMFGDLGDLPESTVVIHKCSVVDR